MSPVAGKMDLAQILISLAGEPAKKAQAPAWQSKWRPKWVASQKKWQPKLKPKWQQQKPKWQNKKVLWVRSCKKDTQVDGTALYTGSVKMYNKWKGVGFITLNEKGVLPDDQVFVHWSNLFTDDRYPFLAQGMEVEFGLQVWKFEKSRGMEAQIRAKHVTEIGGATIAIQDKLDAEAKMFVGEQHTRFPGILKYYDAKKGMGKVVLGDSVSLKEPVPKELLVEDTEVNAGGKKPGRMFEKRHEIEVEFGIWKNSSNQYKVYNMTMPGGVPFTQEALDRREISSELIFSGTISQWWWKQGWGFITPQHEGKLPASVKAKLSEMQAAARRRAGDSTLREKAKVLFFSQYDVEKGFTPKKGASCAFQIYIDEKGVGATHIR